MILDEQGSVPRSMEDLSRSIPKELDLRRLAKDFKHAQILPAYYTWGEYVIRINAANDTYLSMLDGALRRRLETFCGKHGTLLFEKEEIHKEGNRFTKQYVMTASSNSI